MVGKTFFSRFVRGRPDECWLWLGRRNPKGYGVFNSTGTPQMAHRLSYEHYIGPIPEGLCACHKCDNPSCVNPHHIFIGTKADNNRDMTRKRRHWKHSIQTPEEWAAIRLRHGANVKITEATVIAIREAYIAGISRKDIAEKYGVALYSVSDFTSGRTWRHLFTLKRGPTLEQLRSAKRVN